MKIFSKQSSLAVCLFLFLLCTKVNASIIYDFDIDISYSGDLTSSQIDIFNEAEAFWEDIIIGYSDAAGASFLGLNLSITASSDYIDGENGVLGSAGPEYGYYTTNNLYVTSGSMTFDSADMASLESSGSLFDVVIHEMAHVIGFGSLWEIYGLLNDDDNYIGEFGLAGYQIDQNNFDLTYVPVEQDGGDGTADSHWDEAYGGGDSEIMTGWLDPNPTISLATIYSFMDLGYVINPDYYSIEVPEPSTLVLFLFALLGLKRHKHTHS